VTNHIGSFSYYLLLALQILVGIDIGANRAVLNQLRKLGLRILFIPAAIIIGSLLGGLILSFFIPYSIPTALAISSGMGYYTLSSLILTQSVGSSIGTLAFLTNIIRETLTFALIPFLARRSHLAPLASAGATSMDNTLPMIIRFGPKSIGLVSIISGVILTLAVPFLVTFFIHFI
ncbi:MAG: lysine exporter LysO family protein, partial [Nanoarchaeota archaeon]